MKIVVIGGSGLIGTKLVSNLRQRGHEVVAASSSSGINTITGEGLAEALVDAQVVVDVANSPSWEDTAVLNFFETSGRNLRAAEGTAGVRHHVALSVVGTDRLLASGYFRAKMAQERNSACRRHRTKSAAGSGVRGGAERIPGSFCSHGRPPAEADPQRHFGVSPPFGSPNGC
jgi:NAD(P)-dependent dehydrogenase (short-subunit alcohol dehydrogenase family)